MNRYNSILLLLIIVISGFSTLLAHSKFDTDEGDRDRIIAPVVTLFDSMRAQDTTLLRSVFIKNPNLATISGQQNELTYRDEATLDDFVNSIGSHTGTLLDERINTDEIIVQSDGIMATAWVPYQFFLGDTFSHCGVNVFIMMRDKSGNWKVTSITDTRRKEECEI